MKNELVGYRIRDKYYMESHISINDSGKEDGKELCSVYVFNHESTEAILEVEAKEIERIYKYDKLASEIYKIRIEQLERIVITMDSSIKNTLDVADETLVSLESEIKRNRSEIRDIIDDQYIETRRREYDRWRVPMTNTITEYVLPDYQKVFNIFISVAIMIIIICLYFIA